jgi:hypothetical protein
VTIRDCGFVFGFCNSNGEEEEEEEEERWREEEEEARLEGTWRGSKGDYLRDGFVFWDTRYGAL